jgi:hypothetical protein
MTDFLAEVRRLEWEPTEGLWAPAIVDHTNTRFDFAGANYAPFDDLINDYTVQFSGVVERVDLLGSNNDLIDVLIPTGVSVVPSNSAGLQIVISGSGLSAGEALQLQDIHKLLGLNKSVNITITPTGIDSDDADIDIDLTGDGISSTTMDRQP